MSELESDDASVIDSPVGPPPEDQPTGGGAGPVCAVHPGIASTGVCTHCGTFGCDDCLGYLKDRLICATCITEGRVATYDGVPWEKRAELGTWVAMWRTVRDVTLRPNHFFDALSPNASVGDALVFRLAAIVPILGVWAVLGSLGGVAVGAADGSFEEGAVILGIALGVAVILPMSYLFFALVGGLIQHVLLLLFGGGRKGLNATLLVSLYGGGIAFWLIIPCAHYVLGIWQMVLFITGYSKVHDEPAWKAVAAVLTPVVLCCGGYVLFAFALGVAGEL